MPWPFGSSHLAGVNTVDGLRRTLGTHLSRLSRLVRTYEQTGTLVYGATVRSSGEISRHLLVTITNATAFTLANPINPREGVELTYDFFNNTAGAIGAVTFGSEFELAGAFVPPGAGKHRLYSFIRTNLFTWRETRRSPKDLPVATAATDVDLATGADQATFVNAQTDITGLAFPIRANETWRVRIVLSATLGVAATGVKFYFTVPAGCTGEMHARGNVATLATWQSLYQAVLTVPGTFFITGIITGSYFIDAVIRNGATPGTVQLVGITGGATTTCAVKKGSQLTARPL